MGWDNRGHDLDSHPDVDTSTTAPTDGQALVWDDANSEWIPGDAGASSPLTTKGDLHAHDGSADARLPVGSDGLVLTADSSTATGLKWAAGAGGSGTTWLDPVASGNGPGGTDDDEFDDGSIAAAWTELTVSGSAAWTEDQDVLSVRYSSQTSGDLTAQLRNPSSIPTGTYIETAVRVMGHTSNSHMAGICFSDGTGSTDGLMSVAIWRVSNQDRLQPRSGTFTDWTTTPGSAILDFHSTWSTWVFLRLTYVSANTWTPQASPDGASWSDLGMGTSIASTLTPTHVGLIASSYGGSAERISTFEYFRMVTP